VRDAGLLYSVHTMGIHKNMLVFVRRSHNNKLNMLSKYNTTLAASDYANSIVRSPSPVFL